MKTRLSYALECVGRHIILSEPDAKGHIFCSLACPRCADISFCLKAKALIEREINTKKMIGEALRSK